MSKIFNIRTFGVLLVALTMSINTYAEKLVWPPQPDEPRIEFVDELICKDFKLGSGFFSKVKNLISGRGEEDILSKPYDVVVRSNKMYLTCQGIPYLIEINLEDNSFKKYYNKKNPFIFPLCLCDGGDGTIFVTDTETRIVYEFKNGKVKPFIWEGLSRPTGITANPSENKIYIVDTGDHDLKIYNYQGQLVDIISEQLAKNDKFHFPTFASTTAKGNILINDAMNYKIKLFDPSGKLLKSFGTEGDGPGSFSRPKGIATDSENNIYVVDNLFDNFQIFDNDGRILLAVGTTGQFQGQFWSPSGVSINNDTIYIADTYNNRIQIFHFLGGGTDEN